MTYNLIANTHGCRGMRWIPQYSRISDICGHSNLELLHWICSLVCEVCNGHQCRFNVDGTFDQLTNCVSTSEKNLGFWPTSSRFWISKSYWDSNIYIYLLLLLIIILYIYIYLLYIKLQ